MPTQSKSIDLWHTFDLWTCPLHFVTRIRQWCSKVCILIVFHMKENNICFKYVEQTLEKLLLKWLWLFSLNTSASLATNMLKNVRIDFSKIKYVVLTFPKCNKMFLRCKGPSHLWIDTSSIERTAPSIITDFLQLYTINNSDLCMRWLSGFQTIDHNSLHTRVMMSRTRLLSQRRQKQRGYIFISLW